MHVPYLPGSRSTLLTPESCCYDRTASHRSGNHLSPFEGLRAGRQPRHSGRPFTARWRLHTFCWRSQASLVLLKSPAPPFAPPAGFQQPPLSSPGAFRSFCSIIGGSGASRDLRRDLSGACQQVPAAAAIPSHRQRCCTTCCSFPGATLKANTLNMPGQNQIGDYKLIELAGEGSFGKVRREAGVLQGLCPAVIAPLPRPTWMSLSCDTGVEGTAHRQSADGSCQADHQAWQEREGLAQPAAGD